MKKINKILWVLFLFSFMFITSICAFAEDWKISNICLEHTSVEFQISGAKKAQEATFVIETSDYYSSKDTEKVYYEIPFRISSSTEKFQLKIPNGGYLPPNSYDVYVKDNSGNKTYESWTSLYEHYFFIDYDLYPNWAEVKNLNDEVCNVRISVGFKNYDVRLEPNASSIIKYPSQEIGTAIEIKCWDDYGCTDSYIGDIENEYLSLPSLRVFKSSVSAFGCDLSDNERVVVSVEGKVYYSEYGVRKNSYEVIPNFITFPQVSSKTKTIKAWVESKNGSKSEPEEENIEKCDLSCCSIDGDAYLAQVVGKVKENEYGNKITKVKTTIDGKEYSCSVDSSGNYKLSYPKQSAYKNIVLVFSDSHGCSVEETFMVWNSLETKDCDIYALLSKATGKIGKDCRLAAKIGKKTYYSKYATKTQKVTVTYPKQKPGTKVVFWYEKKDTSQSPLYTVPIIDRKYYISVEAKTKSLKGIVEADFDNNSTYKVYVKVGKKEYECKLKKKKGESYYEISCTYPLQKVGSKISIIVKDSDGYKYVKKVTLKNIKPTLTVNQIDTSATKVKGKTKAKSKITVKVGKKTYKGTADKKGKFSIKIKSQKAGTKVTVSVVTPEGYTNKTTQKIVTTYGYAELSKNIYKTSTTANLVVFSGKKGDKIKVKVGEKSYSYKIKKSSKKQNVSIKIKKANAGTKVSVSLYDKFGKKKDSFSSMVYYGDKIYVGMSSKNATLTTWGEPIRRNDWGTGTLQWVYKSGSSTLYAYISNGKVVNIQHLNY